MHKYSQYIYRFFLIMGLFMELHIPVVQLSTFVKLQMEV